VTSTGDAPTYREKADHTVRYAYLGTSEGMVTVRRLGREDAPLQLMPEAFFNQVCEEEHGTGA